MEEFVGTYQFENDNGKFEDFLKALNVSFFLRKIASKSTATIELSLKEDGTVVIKTITTFTTKTLEFKLDQEFEEKRMDGSTCKTTVRRDGNKLIQNQTADIPVEVTREFTGDKLVVTSICKDVVSVRHYKKVSK